MNMRHRNQWLLDFIGDKSVPTKLVEYIIAHLNLKIVEEMRRGRLGLRDAEDLLYNLDVSLKLNRRKVSKVCREIVDWGMQLEDWIEYTPSKTDDAYELLERFSEKILAKKTSTMRRTFRKKQPAVVA